MREIQRPMILFSVSRGIDAVQDHDATFAVTKDLKEMDVSYKSLLGKDGGIQEQLFLIPFTPENLQYVMGKTWEYRQKYFITLDEDRNAQAYYLNISSWVPMGKLVAVGKKDHEWANKTDAWTFDYLTKTYYVIEK